ncbi:hypothetical protein JHK87_004822 [Glycine soja]|nr:hypothetical protein JHK87_004822 [Glycine soja]
MKEIEVVSKTSKSSSSDLEIEIAKLLYGLKTSKSHESSKKFEASVNPSDDGEAPKEDIGEDRMNSSAGFGDASADGRSVSPTKESPSCSKGLNKLVHLWLQGVALASGIFWIWRKFQGKDGIVANFYSLHSWMGLASVSLFRPQIKISRGVVSQGNGFASKFVMADKKMDNKIPMVTKKEGFLHKNHVEDVESKRQLLKQQMLFNQQRDIQELKHTIHTTKASMQFLQMKFHEEFSNLGMFIA